MTHSFRIASLAAVLLAAYAGCSPSQSATYQATGEVLYNDQHVEGAQVMFLSADRRSGTATTDVNGKFTLTTFGELDGVIPGSHQVTITKNVSAPTTPDNPYPRPKNQLPQRYARADQSQLTAEVTPEGENHFTFELSN